MVNKSPEWVRCPICGNKTRLQLRADTELKNFPLYCPKGKQESLIDAVLLFCCLFVREDGFKANFINLLILGQCLNAFEMHEADNRCPKEEARQFYIRREILRAIAAHTCHDVYHLDMLNFGFLLIMADDAQEWGRKRISEL